MMCAGAGMSDVVRLPLVERSLLRTRTPGRYSCARMFCGAAAVRVVMYFSRMNGRRYGPFFYGECRAHPSDMAA